MEFKFNKKEYVHIYDIYDIYDTYIYTYMSESPSSLEAVLANSKTYEDIQERKSYGFADIEKALDIVREFIVRKKRILYGGMSIDISLRLSDNPGIYADDAIPDYDFYSPDIEGDSNEIADILHKAGFEGTYAHNAQHATTRRVKINLANNVADVSYMPKEIYDRIPTQMYKGMRVTHPLFQWMDMHRALSQPFEKPPWEVIAHRVHKDIKRYKLMYSAYGIPYKKEYISAYGSGSGGEGNGEGNGEDSIEVDVRNMHGCMIGGYQAYAILHCFLRYMIDEGSLFHSTLKDVGTLDSVKELLNQTALATFIAKGTCLQFEFPKNAQIGDAHKRVVVISDDFLDVADNCNKEVFSGKAKREYYEMYGDYLRPRTILLAESGKNPIYEIFDNLGHMQPGYDLYETISILHKINPNAKKSINLKASGTSGAPGTHGTPGTPGTPRTTWITGSQNILLYALQKYHDYNTPETEREYHLYMYQSTVWLIEAAEKVVHTLRNASGVKQSGFIDMYKKLPFFLTTQTYGQENWSADYLSLTYHKTYIVQGVQNDKQKKTRPTYAYHPENPHTDEKFDVESSPVFQMSGKKVIEPFIAVSLDPHILEK